MPDSIANPPADSPIDVADLSELSALSVTLKQGASQDLQRFLALATRMFDATYGIVSRVDGARYTIVRVAQPGSELAEGDAFELGHTYCAITLEARDVVAIDEMGVSDHRGHPCYGAFQLERYIGVPLYVDGAVYGTLNFSSKAPRAGGWKERDRALVRLLAHWVETSILTHDLTARLAETAEQLAHANRQLEARNRDLMSFAHLASHDLQEPLRKLTGFSEILRVDLGDDLTDDVARDLNYIVDAAQRMRELVNGLLQVAAFDSVQDPRRVALTEVLDAALDELTHLSTETEIVREPLPVVSGDRAMLLQVFTNLVGNAVKFSRTQPAPRVQIRSTSDDAGWVTLEVLDNGIGIPQEACEQVFGMFERLHPASTFPGTGLGLSICRKIVQAHGGTILARPRPEGGTAFVFTLPIAPPEA